MKWRWDVQPCCSLFSNCLSSCWVLWGSWSEACFIIISPDNKPNSMCFSWARQEKLTVKSVNESQTFNCVSGDKFQDFGYLTKILSLDSFPMWCQNDRRVNVWTGYFRATVNSSWVCVSPAQISGWLFSYRGHTYLNLFIPFTPNCQRKSGNIDGIHPQSWLFGKLESQR